MIFNITYPSKKTDKEISELVGDSYSLLERFKMGGVGSPKMIIEMASMDIAELLGTVGDIRYCNIEIRKGGILVGFNSTRRVYVLAIPFYELVLYHNAKLMSIYSNSSHLKLRPFFNSEMDRKFVIKITERKAEYMQRYKPF